MNHPLTRSVIHRPIALLLPALLAAPGCSDDRSLVVATPWDRASCLAIDAAFHPPDGPVVPPIRWVRLATPADPAQLLDARPDIDVLLGWPASALDTLEQNALVESSSPDPSPRWIANHPDPATADPRLDPLARDAVALALDAGGWRNGYALLIGHAAGQESTPSTALPPVAEGAAIVSESDHPEARTFLVFVARRFAAEATPPPAPIDPASARLAAELVGATAFDAARELRSAWAAADRSPDPDAARSALAEPPPWPPASIQQWRDDPDLAPLLATLAAELAEDDASRSWLLESWERPARPIDRAFLDELAEAGGGRLADGPRVLPWLRAEWAAWARQRYARLAREAAPAGANR